MTPRSKKYHERKKNHDGSKKGSANKAGYDEQNEITIKAPKENPAPSEKEDKAQSRFGKTEDTQEDTDGEK
ncbi:MAG TPA: hypothetical protein VGW31_12215 [Hanamia sp.]|nr:hypothetical protein [Hanamia sp.]